MFWLRQSSFFFGFVLRRSMSDISKNIEELTVLRAQQLASSLKVSQDSALQMVRGHNVLLTRDWRCINHTLSFLEEKRIRLEDIQECYKVLGLKYGLATERYELLREMGFIRITCLILFRCPNYIAYCAVDLKQSCFMADDWDPLEGMLASIKCDEEVKDTIRKKLVSRNYMMDMSLKEVHETVVVEYLRWRLNYEVKADDPLLSKLSKFHCKSCRSFQDTIDFLINGFHYSPAELQRNFVLVNTTPENLRKLLSSSLLTEAGVLKDVKRYEELLCIDNDVLEEKVRFFRSAGMSNEQIFNGRRILLISMDVLEKKFEQIRTSPEIWAMKSYPKFLPVVKLGHRARQNAEILKSAGYVAISLGILHNRQHTEDRVAYGNDACRGLECSSYLAQIFGRPVSEVRQNLLRHPRASRISALNTQNVVEALLGRGVSMEQLWNCLYIVLYDFDVILKYLDSLQGKPELQPFDECRKWANFLDLVLYYIAKKSHFEGDDV